MVARHFTLISLVCTVACSGEQGFSSGTAPETVPEDPAPVTTPAQPQTDPTPEATVPDPELTEPPFEELTVAPNPVDFGDIGVGCTDESVVTVTNTGELSVVVDDVTVDDANFLTIPDVLLPTRLAPGDSFLVDVAYGPGDVSSHSGLISVHSMLGVATADVLGNAVTGMDRSELFTFSASPPTDLVFIVDQSGSMGIHQSELNDNFEGFIANIEAYSTDWHIIVANSDDGCTNSGLLTNTTPDYQNLFESAVERGGGRWLEDDEALLTVSANAADNMGPGLCNEGFMRPDAMLHFVLVTDEQDQSNKNWDHYVERIRAVKGDDSLVRISAFIDDGWGNDEGYWQAVDETGGLNADIDTNNWATYMPALAQASFASTRFTLAGSADPASVEVYVDGVLADPMGWSFDGTSVQVDAAILDLDGGEEVDVRYNEPLACN